MEEGAVNHQPLPIGIDNFEKLITHDYYFVDKTLLIKDLLDNKADVNLFTRPRRFGKTLNMSMLQYYFEDMRDEFCINNLDKNQVNQIMIDIKWLFRNYKDLEVLVLEDSEHKYTRFVL